MLTGSTYFRALLKDLNLDVREPTTTSGALIPKPPEDVSQFWDRWSLFTELVIPAWPTRPLRARFPHGVLGRIAKTDRTTGHRSVRHSAPVEWSNRAPPSMTVAEAAAFGIVSAKTVRRCIA